VGGVLMLVAHGRRPPRCEDQAGMAELPGGTVTFLFTDVEGSTELVKRLQERYAEVLAAHYDLLRRVFAVHDGVEIGTQGDALFVVFGRARDAVEAAVAAQRALGDHRWPDEARVSVRMGLHTGEPYVADEDYTLSLVSGNR
jgi:class 3 adenylate cyclase